MAHADADGGVNRGSLYILGCRVDRVDAHEAAARISQLVERKVSAHVVTIGAEMANLAYADREYRDTINAADLVVPDTVGIVIASRLLRAPVPERVAGIDLLERLCADAAARGDSIYLLGGADGAAMAAAGALVQRHDGLRIAGAEHGYFREQESAAVCERIRSSGARLVFVGLGFPRQERWIREHLADLGPAVCIGVGGSFDVISGRLPRAPRALRQAGLEWLYRLVREPRRFRRQLALPIFAVRALVQSFGTRVGTPHTQVK
ncbi:MAG: WecB/TagA/CpsF family glycosyltransferase [Candidatus Eremiobacteraeota bacterium]|nr:WecB/TagA/CpsF family glycosyltransferase [Candidatus Eremiobacteraeota bacterium]MBV8222440.1 WecB/TagA/CpsF family glycosyltransferase [Candidatus Eremiobacteraeota bacterium]